MDKLFELCHKLLRETDIRFCRYIYDRVNWKNRMIGLTGQRGVGKTTLVLQYIKKNLKLSEALYVTAEDFYFVEHKLLDLAADFVKQGGKHLFIDEIHKYKDWAKELKLIYDYHAELQVVFTGSSILDIKKGASDLSRRAVMYNMQGLSFREYLQLFHNISTRTYSLHEIINHQVEIKELAHPLPLFNDYLKRGYYPLAKDDDYDLRLRQILSQTLEIDIPMFANMNMATGRKLKQLLVIIAQSVPFKPNFSKIAERLLASRNNIADYCLYIEEAGLIAQLRDAINGLGGLGKINKIYLDNTNLIYNLAEENANIGNVRETFFLNQARVMADVVSSSVSDFQIDTMTFEVGGRSKKQKQIQNITQGFIVKDDIEFGYNNVIPLWCFGMGY